MGNTTMKWMTLYRQERKAHQKEIETLNKEWEETFRLLHMKEQWLSDQLIASQAKNRTLTHEIERKEALIDDLQEQLRRKTELGRSFKKKAPLPPSVPSRDR